MAPNTTPTTQRKRLNSIELTDVDINLRHSISRSRVKQTAIEVLDYVVKRKAGWKTANNSYGELMFTLTEDMRKKHKIFFNGLRNKLDFSPDKLTETFSSVSVEIFESGFNFGRLVSLYAWSAYVLDYCSQQKLENEANSIFLITEDVVGRHDTEFRELGGWDGFKKYFADPKNSVWQCLLLTTLSLGAVAGLLFARS